MGRSSDPVEFVDGYLSYLSGLLTRIDSHAIAEVIQEIEAMGKRGGTLYVLGNGGSAATASHMVNDWAFGIRSNEGPFFRVIGLADNSSVITALANDIGFEDIFVEQLKVYLRPLDVVLAISVSGNSNNVLKAVDFARKVGAKVVTCTGFDGGRLQGLGDIRVHVPTIQGEYGPTEDLFQILDHIVYSYFRFRS